MLFRRGPVVAAYPRFPLGLMLDDKDLLTALQDKGIGFPASRVDMLRLSAPDLMLDQTKPVRGVALQETRIDQLQLWSAERLSANVRRKFRQARELRMAPAVATDGPILHRLYCLSLARQNGVPKYPARYFTALCSLGSDAPLSVGKAVTTNGTTAAFVVVGHELQCSYYLHGGYDERFSRLRPGYLTMRWAIERSMERGATAFDLMASPNDQPSLVAYKEGFGGLTRIRWHWDVSLTVLGQVARVALVAAQNVRRVLRL